jgi:hypothetical protein
MAQEKRLQEFSDPVKLLTAEGTGLSRNKDEPPCESGTAEGTWASETRKRRYCTENPERMDVQDEMLEVSGMQK